MAAQRVGTSHVPPATNGGPPAPVTEDDDLEGSQELRLIRAFAARRRPGDKRLSANASGNGTSVNGPAAAPPSSVEEAEPKTKGKTKRNKSKSKSKNIGKRLGRLFSCVSAPQEAEADDDGTPKPSSRSAGGDPGERC